VEDSGRKAGTVALLTVLTDNLVTPITGYGRSDVVAVVKEAIHDALSALRVPPAGDGSHVTVSILVPIPDLHPIEFSLPHDLSREAITRSRSIQPNNSMLGIEGSWNENERRDRAGVRDHPPRGE